MRLSSLAALLLAAAASWSAPARAQTTTGTNSCTTSGQNPAGTSPVASFTLAIKQGTSFTTLPTTVIQNVLDFAECQCDSQDLFLQGLITTPISSNPPPTLTTWEGGSCSVVTSQPTSCQNITGLSGSAVSQAFIAGSNLGIPRQQVHVPELISPLTMQVTQHSCPASSISNSVWLLFGNQQAPDSCQVSLSYYGALPSLPTGVSAGSGDEAITLTWTPPASGVSNRPTYYQVLCAVANQDQTAFVPAPGQGGGYSFGQSQNGHELAYSTCVDPANHVIQRRYISTSGAVGVVDAGVSSGADASLFSGPIGSWSATGGGHVSGQDDPIGPQGDPVDGGTALPASCLPLYVSATNDMAVVDMTTPPDLTLPDLAGADLAGADLAGPDLASPDMVSLDMARPVDSATAGDMATTPPLTVAKLFPNLDKSFVCSDKLGSTTTSIRISGLQNNVPHYFTVVAIDAYGNASTTDPVCAVPHFVDDAYRRFLESGGKPQGFCFIATAAFGSYQSPFVMVLRDFRDQVLAPTDTGAAFIAWYYRTSPPIADWIRPRGWARFAVRTALWPVIVAAGLWMWLSPAEALLVLGLLVALAYSRRQRRPRSAVAAPATATTLVAARSEA